MARSPLTLVCLGCGRRSVELVGHAPPARRPSDRSPSDALRVAANHRLGARSAAVPSFTRTVAWARARTCKAGTHGLWHSHALLSASTYRRTGPIPGLRRLSGWSAPALTAPAGPLELALSKSRHL